MYQGFLETFVPPVTEAARAAFPLDLLLHSAPYQALADVLEEEPGSSIRVFPRNIRAAYRESRASNPDVAPAEVMHRLFRVLSRDPDVRRAHLTAAVRLLLEARKKTGTPEEARAFEQHVRNTLLEALVTEEERLEAAEQE